MNEEIKKELLGWLQALRNAVETGANFAADQIPLVLWEKILLDRVYLTVMVLSGLAAMLFTVFKLIPGTVKAFQETADASYKDEWPLVFKSAAYVVSSILGGIAGPAMFFQNLYPCLQVWFAPRLYIIEWIRSLLQ